MCGRSGGELLPLMAFRQMAYNTVYVTKGLIRGSIWQLL